MERREDILNIKIWAASVANQSIMFTGSINGKRCHHDEKSATRILAVSDKPLTLRHEVLVCSLTRGWTTHKWRNGETLCVQLFQLNERFTTISISNEVYRVLLCTSWAMTILHPWIYPICSNIWILFANTWNCFEWLPTVFCFQCLFLMLYWLIMIGQETSKFSFYLPWLAEQ